jgi:glycosyltransferase involved in cell wall biosynthesis
MKIICILEYPINSGGGFNQAINDIIQMKKVCENRFEFEVFTSLLENISHLKKLGIPAKHFSVTFFDKLIFRFAFSSWWYSIQSRFRFVTSFEKKLLENGCDIVYFTTPSGRSAILQNLNFISTVWDLDHRDTPEFPEVREYSLFHKREHYYKNCLSSAILVITASEELNDRLFNRYGIDRERMLSIPFASSPFMNDEFSRDKEQVLQKYDLKEGYFFYPAQFWSHKNHIRILEALVVLKEQKTHSEVVFAGGDQGNLAHIEHFINQHNLSENVKLIGFVDPEDMRGLYENCKGLVMPTYFGPTNLPPIEAWSIGKPAICSETMKGQVEDAAILVNPDSKEELVNAMKKLIDGKDSDKLIQLGFKRLKEHQSEKQQAESKLLSCLLQFAARRQCWK